MRGLNKACLLGYVGRDPEILTSNQNTLIARFSLATDESRKDSGGNWQNVAEWHALVCFGKEAETARDYIRKGSQLYIEGRLQTRSFDDPDSPRKRYRTEIIVSQIFLLGPKPDGAARSSTARSSTGAAIRESSTAQSSTARGEF